MIEETKVNRSDSLASVDSLGGEEWEPCCRICFGASKVAEVQQKNVSSNITNGGGGTTTTTTTTTNNNNNNNNNNNDNGIVGSDNNRRLNNNHANTTGTANASSAAAGSFIASMTGDGTDRLFSPCLCSGSIKYVHESCLQQWRSSGSRSARIRCPQCKFVYKTRRVGSKKRVIAFRILRWVLALLLALGVNVLFAAVLPYTARCVLGEDPVWEHEEEPIKYDDGYSTIDYVDDEEDEEYDETENASNEDIIEEELVEDEEEEGALAIAYDMEVEDDDEDDDEEEEEEEEEDEEDEDEDDDDGDREEGNASMQEDLYDDDVFDEQAPRHHYSAASDERWNDEGFFLHFHWEPAAYAFLLSREVIWSIRDLDYEWQPAGGGARRVESSFIDRLPWSTRTPHWARGSVQQDDGGGDDEGEGGAGDLREVRRRASERAAMARDCAHGSCTLWHHLLFDILPGVSWHPTAEASTACSSGGSSSTIATTTINNNEDDDNDSDNDKDNVLEGGEVQQRYKPGAIELLEFKAGAYFRLSIEGLYFRLPMVHTPVLLRIGGGRGDTRAHGGGAGGGGGGGWASNRQAEGDGGGYYSAASGSSSCAASPSSTKTLPRPPAVLELSWLDLFALRHPAIIPGLLHWLPAILNEYAVSPAPRESSPLPTSQEEEEEEEEEEAPTDARFCRPRGPFDLRAAAVYGTAKLATQCLFVHNVVGVVLTDAGHWLLALPGTLLEEALALLALWTARPTTPIARLLVRIAPRQGTVDSLLWLVDSSVPFVWLLLQYVLANELNAYHYMLSAPPDYSLSYFFGVRWGCVYWVICVLAGLAVQTLWFVHRIEDAVFRLAGKEWRLRHVRVLDMDEWRGLVSHRHRRRHRRQSARQQQQQHQQKQQQQQKRQQQNDGGGNGGSKSSPKKPTSKKSRNRMASRRSPTASSNNDAAISN